ncbi:hypothetical protein MPTK1_5g07480 [Marchantia polymorpha subsp. ruderalis]|uniref:Uncharacterized protein n=2 Tax=Marchantia polymorpha TaxID=3197 RepID=A0AAF6BFX7_MARPO|nr:hypothetical protein MARPO_0127s0036 [Marchantia polymorpha]BBN10911.1 hypothetical protein Mp_5g07480 [Marchantia polymorpha subsp. ruderalis]|eukprot:PTQ30253.1 hypothetical protein MARPO_0127s0036 [Marchantia polymorpha]
MPGGSEIYMSQREPWVLGLRPTLSRRHRRVMRMSNQHGCSHGSHSVADFEKHRKIESGVFVHWSSALQDSHVVSVRIPEQPGKRVACLLNLIEQQVQCQKYLWSSELRVSSGSECLPLRQIRARRLRALFALAQLFDQKSRNSVPFYSSEDGMGDLEVHLSTISLSD